MKKLFFLVLFSIGYFTVSHAQVLFYTVENQSAYAWDFKIGDGNGNGNYIPPFTVGTQGGQLNNFGFNLEFGSTSSIGCSAYVNLASAPASGSASYPCWVPSNYGYILFQLNPFVYILQVEIS